MGSPVGGSTDTGMRPSPAPRHPNDQGLLLLPWGTVKVCGQSLLLLDEMYVILAAGAVPLEATRSPATLLPGSFSRDPPDHLPPPSLRIGAPCACGAANARARVLNADPTRHERNEGNAKMQEAFQLCVFPFPDQEEKENYQVLTFSPGLKIHPKYRKWRACNTGLTRQAGEGSPEAPSKGRGRGPSPSKGRGRGQSPERGSPHTCGGCMGVGAMQEGQQLLGRPAGQGGKGRGTPGSPCSHAPVSCRCRPAARLTGSPGKRRLRARGPCDQGRGRGGATWPAQSPLGRGQD